jgi:hypothetical protein
MRKSISVVACIAVVVCGVAFFLVFVGERRQSPLLPLQAFDREVRDFYALYNENECEVIHRKATVVFKEEYTQASFCALLRERFLKRGRFLSGKSTTHEVKRYPNGDVTVLAEFEGAFERQTDWDYFSIVFEKGRLDGRLVIYLPSRD